MVTENYCLNNCLLQYCCISVEIDTLSVSVKATKQTKETVRIFTPQIRSFLLVDAIVYRFVLL